MAAQAQSIFRFQPRWKEELVVAGPGGRLVLELPMGHLTAYLPTENVWKDLAPDWAFELWPMLKAELEIWCAANQARLKIDPTASVAPYAETQFG